MAKKKTPKHNPRQRGLETARLIGIITATPRKRDNSFRFLVAEFGTEAWDQLNKIPAHRRGTFLGAMLVEAATQAKQLAHALIKKPKSG